LGLLIKGNAELLILPHLSQNATFHGPMCLICSISYSCLWTCQEAKLLFEIYRLQRIQMALTESGK